jgi:uncharacterized phage protein (TIGR02218 family)
MTKTISGPLKTHIAGPVTRLATLWRVERKDGQSFGFTDHDVDIVFDDGNGLLTYEAETGYSRTAISLSIGLGVDNIDLRGFLSSDSITEQELRAGVWDNAQVFISQVNHQDLSQGQLKLLRGTLGEVSIGDESFNVELRSLSQPWQQTITRVYTPNCTADLGDARCKVDLSAFRQTGTVASVVDARTITTTGISGADDFHNYGLLTFTSGPNEGSSLEINNWMLSTETLRTWLGFPFEPQVGDTIEVIPGCNKTTDHCINKFDNIENYRGFPTVPNQRKVQRINTPSD